MRKNLKTNVAQTPPAAARKSDGFPEGFLEPIDLESYRAEARAQMAILLEDADAEVDPVPESGAGGKSEPEARSECDRAFCAQKSTPKSTYLLTSIRA